MLPMTRGAHDAAERSWHFFLPVGSGDTQRRVHVMQDGCCILQQRTAAKAMVLEYLVSVLRSWCCGTRDGGGKYKVQLVRRYRGEEMPSPFQVARMYSPSALLGENVAYRLGGSRECEMT